MKMKVHKALEEMVKDYLGEIEYKVEGEEGSHTIYNIDSDDDGLKKKLHSMFQCISMEGDSFQMAYDLQQYIIKKQYKEG